MIGLSLSLCVKDVIEGRVALEDVEKIVSGVFYTDRDMFHVGMKLSYCPTYWRRDPERAHAIAMQLWDDGRLVLPRLRGEDPPCVTDGHWLTGESLS